MPLGNFVLSCFQVSNTEAKGGINILNGAGSGDKECTKVKAFSTHRPSAFRYDNSTATLGCGWDSTSLGLRMFASLVVVIITGASFYFSVIRRSKLTYIFFILLIAAAVAFGWFTYRDSSLVSASQKWCNKKLTGVKFVKTPARVSCIYGPFIAVCVLDAFNAACLVGLAVLMVIVKRNPPDFINFDRWKKDKKGSKKVTKLKDPLMDSNAPATEAGAAGADVVFPEGEDKKQEEEEEEEQQKDYDSVNVDFDSQSKKRFPPMSKTAVAASQQQQMSGTTKTSTTATTTAAGDFDFSQMDSSADDFGAGNKSSNYAQQAQLKRQQESQRVQHHTVAPTPPQKPPPPPPKPKPQPAPVPSNGDFDFESYVPDN